MNSNHFVKLVQCLDDSCLFLVVHNAKKEQNLFGQYYKSINDLLFWGSHLFIFQTFSHHCPLFSLFAFLLLLHSVHLGLCIYHDDGIFSSSITPFVLVCQLIFSLYHLQLPLKNKYLNINSNRCQNLFSFQQAIRGWFCHRISHFCDLVLKWDSFSLFHCYHEEKVMFPLQQFLQPI